MWKKDRRGLSGGVWKKDRRVWKKDRRMWKEYERRRGEVRPEKRRDMPGRVWQERRGVPGPVWNKDEGVKGENEGCDRKRVCRWKWKEGRKGCERRGGPGYGRNVKEWEGVKGGQKGETGRRGVPGGVWKADRRSVKGGKMY